MRIADYQSNHGKAEIQEYNTLRRCTIPKDQYSPVYQFRDAYSVAMPEDCV